LASSARAAAICASSWPVRAPGRLAGRAARVAPAARLIEQLVRDDLLAASPSARRQIALRQLGLDAGLLVGLASRGEGPLRVEDLGPGRRVVEPREDLPRGDAVPLLAVTSRTRPPISGLMRARWRVLTVPPCCS
jgi:hypothetical protein